MPKARWARAVATRLIERRPEAIVAELERGSAEPPGWALVEIGPRPEPSDERATIRDLRP